MTELNYLDITKASDGHIKVPSIGLTSPAIKESIAKTALASFADGAGGFPFKSLVGYINPVQRGTGDPSPSNVRPITGWTGMNVTRTGKNLFDVGTSSADYWWSGSVVNPTIDTTNKTITIHTVGGGQSWVGRRDLKFQAGTYALSFKNSAYDPRFIIRCYDADDNVLTNSSITISGLTWNAYYGGFYGSANSAAFTVPSTAAYFLVMLGVYNDTSGNTAVLSEIQLEVGSTATTYEPYTGTTLPITFPSTAYSGVADLINGTYTPDDRKMLALASLNWTANASYANIFNGAIPSTKYVVSGKLTDAISNKYKIYTSGNLPNYPSGFAFGTSRNVIYIKDQNYSTVDEFITSLSSVQVLYHSIEAHPSVDITPQDISTVLGTNNVWCDAGDVEVGYVADTKLYIDKVVGA